MDARIPGRPPRDASELNPADGTPVRPGLRARTLEAARLHSERVVYGFTAILVLASWLVLGGFIQQQRADVIHDIRVEVQDAQTILAAHFDTTYESAETLLKIADTWLIANSTAAQRPSLNELGSYLARLTSSDNRAVFLVAVDESERETALVEHRHGPAGATNTLIHAAIDTRSRDGSKIKIGAQRFDPVAGSDVVPVTMVASGNAYGVAYLRALLPIRAGEGPLGALLAGLPARLGALRDNGQILFIWPSTDAKIGQYAPQVLAVAGNPAAVMDHDAQSAEAQPPAFARIDDFPRLGGAFVSYAPLKEAPIGIFAAISTGYANQELLRHIWIPCLITALLTILMVGGCVLIARLIRHNRREAENTQRALNRAEAANEAKRQFLANMSHELRTPLNAIIGFGEILHNQLFGPLGKPQYVSYARDVLESGRHLLGLIQTILDMARFEGGKVILGNSPTPLHDTLRDAIRLLQDRVAAARLDVHLEADPLLQIRIDPLHLRQVLLNVVGNAVKFSRPGGVIAIDAAMAPNGGVMLNVSDTGIGIPAEAVDTLFKPFVQVDSAYSRNHGGVGLGLSICRSIMEAYGGTISLRSQLGTGTAVTLTFPPARVVAAADEGAGLPAAVAAE